MTMDPRVLSEASRHPLRVVVLRELDARGEASPKQITDMVEIGLGNVSYHVSALHTAGLIRMTRQVQRRGALEHFYELTGLGREAWSVVRDWVGPEWKPDGLVRRYAAAS